VDDIGVAGVQLKVDGKPLGAELTAPPYTRSWATTAFLNGTHILTATSRDAAGNATTSAPVTVTVQNGPVSAGCLQSSSIWQNTPIATEASPFQASFDDTPNVANMDGVTGLSLGNAITYTNLAAIVRFNSSGVIDARNGGSYMADAYVPYSPGLSYLFRLQIYPASHAYTIFVTPPAAPEITLGTNFGFRTIGRSTRRRVRTRFAVSRLRPSLSLLHD
jgi:Tfp pilus assembly protein FimT